MVSFSCEVCQETIKKPKLEQHYYRCPNAYYSCVDCSITFQGTEYRSHISCISEAEKYQKSVYKPPKGKNAKLQNGASKEILPNMVKPATSESLISQIKKTEVVESMPASDGTLSLEESTDQKKQSKKDKKDKKRKIESDSEVCPLKQVKTTPTSLTSTPSEPKEGNDMISDEIIKSALHSVLKKKSAYSLSKLREKIIKKLQKDENIKLDNVSKIQSRLDDLLTITLKDGTMIASI
ncbi:hypothetical protein BASA60_010399 [Batrachochytrium salamandrivorans]|nr:hypothetical protein BASA60_010399 [Batrachochytrium salamandrivorans]KAH9256767.1 hypothetical protein BASA81_005061 [Batrachochytrium salamandrivorans]KAH9269108.1 hypothetical protein BASA83_008859 [Batrachochytrium salamandrivorans]